MRRVLHGAGDNSRARGRRILRLLHRGSWRARMRICRWRGERVGTAAFGISRSCDRREDVRTARSCAKMSSLLEKPLSVPTLCRGCSPLFAQASRAMTETTKTVSAKGRAEYRCRRRILGGDAVGCSSIGQVIFAACSGSPRGVL
jgi:hypothetical protein